MKKDWHERVFHDSLEEALDLLREQLDEVFQDCQSPIEKALLAKLYLAGDYWYINWRGGVSLCRNISKTDYSINDFMHDPRSDMSVGIMPQAKIAGYTVDIMINAVFQPSSKNQLKIVIECDGHDFHEKTKEQASKDKKRDRDLQKLGFMVFRYSGSDIYRNIDVCVEEISNVVGKFLEEQMHSYFNIVEKNRGVVC